MLSIWTWDGESSVSAKRWWKGEEVAHLELLNDAFRGTDGQPRAPAKVLRPWRAPDARQALLRDGFPLVAPAEPTGDPELDGLLAGFDEVDGDEIESDPHDDEDDDEVYVDLEPSVAAIAHAAGIKESPARVFEAIWEPRGGDRVLGFRRARKIDRASPVSG